MTKSDLSRQRTKWPLLLVVALYLAAGVQRVGADTAPPPTDPTLPVGEQVDLLPAVMGQHPRLLFTASEVSDLAVFITTPTGQPHYNSLLAYLGSCNAPSGPPYAFLTDATDGQRQGLWRMPTVAVHFALTGSQSSFDKAKAYLDMLLGLPNWETTSEFDSGMSAGNVMTGAAVVYDCLYNDLDPAYREQFRQKLFYHARAMYYLGHLRLSGANPYWQSDPRNNHRFHRNAGLALAMLAVFEGNASEEWMLRQVYDELAFVAQWLPNDGTCHESSSYLVFGASHLALAMAAADRCFGTTYLELPFFQNVGRYRAQLITPGFSSFFMYGDSGTDAGYYNHFAMLAASHHQQPDVQAAMDRLYTLTPSAFAYGWFGVVWHGPNLSGGAYANLPQAAYFDDLGIAFMREGWASGDAAAMFKCGPFGGDKLNTYRNENGYLYINVAHNDPDANAFLLFKDGQFLAETSRYSYAKKSHSHNTILVDGLGQRAAGRPEGQQWTQPAVGAVDMKEMAAITAFSDHGDIVVIEGEAGGSYPEVDRFRRALVWYRGRYVLVLDDIRAAVAHEISWLIQSGDVRIDDTAAHRFTLIKNGVECPFQVNASVSTTVSKVTSSADNRGSSLGWQQLQLKSTSSDLRLTSVYDLWDRGPLTVELKNVTATDAVVHVTGNAVDDTWAWTFAPGTSGNVAGQVRLVEPGFLMSVR